MCVVSVVSIISIIIAQNFAQFSVCFVFSFQAIIQQYVNLVFFVFVCCVFICVCNYVLRSKH